ncbi:MAG: hypothetical protein JXM70_28130 [Pirellulales bacterium]|nr:hypothetical protein [Pirellulales bacterium]
MQNPKAFGVCSHSPLHYASQVFLSTTLFIKRGPGLEKEPIFLTENSCKSSISSSTLVAMHVAGSKSLNIPPGDMSKNAAERVLRHAVLWHYTQI